MKKIALTTREELNIYMSPVRQQLLRLLSLSVSPMTPKMLADKLNISASGVQHHIRKLKQLGLIELDHTETINGIVASFYRPASVTVQIGLGMDEELAGQREALLQDSLSAVYDGFRNQLNKRLKQNGGEVPDSSGKWGDILSGVVHLTDSESEELMKLIYSYIEQHAGPKADASPWEYAIIAYHAGELNHD